MKTKKASRLYKLFRPANYELNIDLSNSDKFKGHVTVVGNKVSAPSKRITLHQRGLKIDKATVYKINKDQKTKVDIARINHHHSKNEVRLHTKETVYPGTYVIEISYSGKITEPMHGIYKSSYSYKEDTKDILATQFESHYAREALPCIDEPEAKATFSVTIKHPPGTTALSNMPSASTKQQNNYQITTFEKTPIMSSYLLAFIVGELHCVETKTKDGIVVRSWGSLARDKKELQYSADECAKALEFFTEYFSVPFPLSKCDQVALPDFDSGAMENWGLITYREIAMLTDPDNRSVSNEQYVSLVIAHEVSHQWFGNLVTMKWWDDLWLNESFASLMEYVALDHIHPEWNVWEMYTASDVLSTTSRDIYSDIQPVGVKVTDPDLIDSLFDPGIVYAKGGRLLKMLKEHVGDEAFRLGLKKYFKQHKYKNATRDDLWEAVSDASGKDIGSLMTPWLEQPGMPVVSIESKNSVLSLSQGRFTLDKDIKGQTWPIPLLTTNEKFPEVMGQDTYEINDFSGNTTINQNGSGHYLVNYQSKTLEKEAQVAILKSSNSSARINYLNDVYVLSRKGHKHLDTALDFINSIFAQEDRDAVWTMVTRILYACSLLTEGDDKTDVEVKKYKKHISKKHFDNLGWMHQDSDDANTRQLRHTMISLMCASEDSEIIDYTKKIYKDSKNINNIDAEIRNTILAANVRHSGPEIAYNLLEQYPNSSPDVQADITSAVSATKDTKLAKDILSKAFGEKGFVRNQDILRWYVAFVRNKYTKNLTWDYLVNNWDWFEAKLSGSKNFDFLPIYSASVMSTQKELNDYQKLFSDKKHIKALSQNIKVGEADIKARIEWRDRDEKIIKQWFNDRA